GSLVTIGMRRTSCRPTGITVVVCMATLIACTGCTMSGPKASGSHALAKSLRESTIPPQVVTNGIRARSLWLVAWPTWGGAGGRRHRAGDAHPRLILLGLPTGSDLQFL